VNQRNVQRHVVVSGTVQGVSFRADARKQADALGVRGWVRNLPDGSVEAVFCGRERDVAAMIAWCERGPLRAEVTAVEVARQPVEAFFGFSVRPDAAAAGPEPA